MFARLFCAIALVAAATPAFGQGSKWPNYQEADFVVKDYRFHSGESLPELKLHYRTLGTAKRDAAGNIVNAVLLLQGNTGTGANWLRPSLADELFATAQPTPMASLGNAPSLGAGMQPMSPPAQQTMTGMPERRGIPVAATRSP